MTRPCDSDTVDAARGRWVPDGPEDSDHDDSQVSRLLRRFKSPLPGSLALKQQSLALQKTESDSNRLVNRAYPGPRARDRGSSKSGCHCHVLAAAADSDSDS